MTLEELLAANVSNVANASKAARARKSSRALSRQKYPRDAERQYQLFLNSVLAFTRDAFKPVFALLPGILPRADGNVPTLELWNGERPIESVQRLWRFDNAEQVRRLLAEVKGRMADALDVGRVERFLKTQESAVSEWSAREFHKQSRAALGVDIFAADPKQRERAAAFVAGNVERVKNLSAETANKISAAVLQAVQDGKSYTQLVKELQVQEGIGESRALTIARDQTGKLYGQINADRQKALGLTKFVWRTSRDTRVREEHEALEGEVFSYDDPPDEGLPGEAINCRCHAEPYFDDLLNQGES